MAPDELLKLALTQETEHALILLDADACIVGWHAAAPKLFGYTAEEMLGQSLERLFTPEDIARGEPALEIRTARITGRAEDDRWQMRKDGVRVWVSGLVTALHAPDGALAGFCKILRDRTDLRGHIDAVENRLDALRKSDDRRDQVLGTLAHELRNPLGPLANAAQIIQLAASDKPEVSYSVKVIERQVRFIEQLVKDLLDLTRVNLGKVQPRFEPTTLAEVVERAIETCSAELERKEQTIEVMMPQAVELEADPLRLQQVLVNLISNASRFSPPGGPIWVKATVDATDVVLRVEDRGQGIPGELLPRIFDLFTQADAQPDAEGTHQGLGLGLALVKQFVEMHHGTVQARSEGAGRGAELIVRLPLRQPASAA